MGDSDGMGYLSSQQTAVMEVDQTAQCKLWWRRTFILIYWAVHQTPGLVCPKSQMKESMCLVHNCIWVKRCSSPASMGLERLAVLFFLVHDTSQFSQLKGIGTQFQRFSSENFPIYCCCKVVKDTLSFANHHSYLNVSTTVLLPWDNLQPFMLKCHFFGEVQFQTLILIWKGSREVLERLRYPHPNKSVL